MNDVLGRILQHKQEEILRLRKRYSPTALRERAAAAGPVRGFKAALSKTVAAGRPAVIAEIKKASPSKGLIRADFEPARIARQYAAGGAAALSVLTDRAFFQGAGEDLTDARAACELPALRKDFLIDPLQIAEARALAADAVLLIAAALSAAQMNGLAACAREFGLEVLVEIHGAGELDAVLAADLLPQALLGINNRDLRSFETRLATTLELLPHLPAGCEVVSESGIAAAADIARLRTAGVQRFLVGESLLREDDPGVALRRLIGG
ncbi:MAG: indole-3-glycerol phosphate synthase TrpC [Gammaproteobacteria bacterium]|nr:indole-3-glycerol phosphate synthase TrpC [Gammaproteobacteria bacterium]